MLQVTNRVPVHCYTTEKRVFLHISRMAYFHYCEVLRTFVSESMLFTSHFPQYLFMETCSPNLHCWDCSPRSLLEYCCVFQAQRQKRLSLFLRRRVTASCSWYHMVQLTEWKNLIPAEKGADSELTISIPVIKIKRWFNDR